MAQPQRKLNPDPNARQDIAVRHGLHNCAIADFQSLCGDRGGASDDCGSLGIGGLVAAIDQTVPARRLIFRERDRLETIPILFSGWAACSVTLSDGRRQILSFLLPGDIAPTALVFDPAAQFSIETVTEVRYRTLRLTDFRAVLLSNADLFDKFSRIWADERHRADQLAIDLGRRGADERIARLIVGLVDRMKQRGLADGDTIDFPLRQHHIADATGLTSVHVSKVLTEFRRAGYLDINGRTLTILDRQRFNSVTNMR